MTRPSTPQTTMAIQPSGAMAAANTMPPRTMRMGCMIWVLSGENRKILSAASSTTASARSSAMTQVFSRNANQVPSRMGALRNSSLE